MSSLFLCGLGEDVSVLVVGKWLLFGLPTVKCSIIEGLGIGNNRLIC